MYWAFVKEQDDNNTLVYTYRHATQGKRTGKFAYNKTTKKVEHKPAYNEDTDDAKHAEYLFLKLIEKEGSPEKRTFAYG